MYHSNEATIDIPTTFHACLAFFSPPPAQSVSSTLLNQASREDLGTPLLDPSRQQTEAAMHPIMRRLVEHSSTITILPSPLSIPSEHCSFLITYTQPKYHSLVLYTLLLQIKTLVTTLTRTHSHM